MNKPPTVADVRGILNPYKRIDEMAELRAANERLRAALEPFAKALQGNWSAQSDNMKIVAGPNAHDLRLEFTLADFRRAALAQENSNE